MTKYPFPVLRQMARGIHRQQERPSALHWAMEELGTVAVVWPLGIVEEIHKVEEKSSG